MALLNKSPAGLTIMAIGDAPRLILSGVLPQAHLAMVTSAIAFPLITTFYSILKLSPGQQLAQSYIPIPAETNVDFERT